MPVNAGIHPPRHRDGFLLSGRNDGGLLPPPLTPFDKLRTNGKSGPLMVSQVPLPVHGEPVEPYER